MKVIKFFILVSVVITIGYFSWNYYTERLLQEKHERARLVYENCTIQCEFPDRRGSI